MKVFDVKPGSYSISIPIRRIAKKIEVRLRYFRTRPIFGFVMAGLVLALASLPLIFAFEAHVINVTATIENCSEFEIESRGYWKNHEADWTLPQTVGIILISNPTDAADMLDANASAMDRLEREVLTLKFNVAKFGVGDSLVPGENIKISELITQADLLLTAAFPNPSPISDGELDVMRLRVEGTNNAGKVSPCKNPPPPPNDCDKDDDDDKDNHDEDRLDTQILGSSVGHHGDDENRDHEDDKCTCKDNRLHVTRVEAGGTVMIMTRDGGGNGSDGNSGDNSDSKPCDEPKDNKDDLPKDDNKGEQGGQDGSHDSNHNSDSSGVEQASAPVIQSEATSTEEATTTSSTETEN